MVFPQLQADIPRGGATDVAAHRLPQREPILSEDKIVLRLYFLCHAIRVLCCAVLCCAVLCCAVLCCAVLCCAVLCCAVLCCAVLCCAVLCAVLCACVCVRVQSSTSISSHPLIIGVIAMATISPNCIL